MSAESNSVSNFDPTDFSLRPATESDAEALAAVHYQSINATFSTLIPEYVQSRSLADFENIWRERVLSPTSFTCILMRGQETVGFVSAGPSRDEDADDKCGSVDRIYLHPSVWEKRLGARLLRWCEENLQERKFNRVQLWVFEPNARAIRFYERNGYKHDGKIKSEFNSQLLRFEKLLPP
ncbi:MAG: hypothetical protein C0507_13890 [Cyanobacteria bacterium PR.3.49]|nr:hypothetical protein [Cyanobacteria bacterium PR.3.49]